MSGTAPFVWLVMSLVVIPLLARHAPTFSIRWWRGGGPVHRTRKIG